MSQFARKLVPLLALVLAACRTLASPTHKEIVAAVQPILTQASEEFNMSFSFGYADGVAPYKTVVGLGVGFDNRCLDVHDDECEKTQLDAHSIIPAGSVTKAYTGVAIMQEVERGRLDLDAPAHTFIDPPLLRQNKTSLLELWGGNQEVLKITARDLLGMTSGLNDYDDGQLLVWTLLNSGADLDPFAMLAVTNKTLTCDKVPCPAYYSSINYLLLGLMLQELHSVAAWEDYDQLSIVHATRRKLYNETVFPKLGRCRSYPVTHQYAKNTRYPPGARHPDEPAEAVVFYDMLDYSCTNGWTMGNVAASAKDLAMFFRDVYGVPTSRHMALLKKESVDEMLRWNNLTNDWTEGYAALGVYYGLATFRCGEFASIVVPGTGDPSSAVYYGHPGADWGSKSSPICGYNPSYNFGSCVVYNSAGGMNCSSQDAYALSARAGNIVSCMAYSALLQLHGGPWLDCIRYPWAALTDLAKSARAGNASTKPHAKAKANANANAYRNPGGNASHSSNGIRGDGVERGEGGDAEVCRWLPTYSTCDVCASEVCLPCKACKHNKKGAVCEPCWEGLLPCLPLCTEEKCW